ncbi:PACE efflux transporter [Ancylobacter dichloromethanicus]|uniref:Membrane protein n=1 Tax=Ancylobacter dichloromethanicus TaxID=518825 RepID=A0A9W6JDE9_9HYPH|nr:PACE efflux transporter [Ancylobacter dichloromethanicus]MBS7556701.1 PACE efflux transporter [Ancylobacter dichloromethanicus]GLK73553.1 membrane protein [Ancylobacter dichloromethanicus]
MRGTADRIRHVVSFEIIALSLITPLGAWVFGVPVFDMGAVGAAAALIAASWNYVFNLGFDHALARWRGSVRKTLGLRVLHAVLFEAGLVAVLVPFVAWYLGVGLVEALLMDLALAGFFLVYAFLFNWSYDALFPLRETAPPMRAAGRV